MSAPSHLRSFQALDLALRTGSLKGAAGKLAITPAAVGQRIKALEDYLGIELVVRGRTGLRPAPELSGAIDHIRRAFEELDRAAAALDLQKADEIHIAANSDLAQLWLRPRLAAFKAMHPNMKFCVNGEGDVPMRLGPADCEIRFRAQENEPGSDLLFRDYLLPVTSQVNHERIAREGNQLDRFPLVHLDFYKDDPEAVNWPDWFSRHGYRTSAFERGMRYQRISPALDAVLSDAGVMICGLALLEDHIRSGDLKQPFPLATGCWTTHAYMARFRQSSLARPQLRRFRDWLLEEAGTTQTGLEALVSGETVSA